MSGGSIGASHCTCPIESTELPLSMVAVVRARAVKKVGPAVIAALILPGYKAEANRRAASAEAPVASKR